jgi:hypothetical protein
MQTWSKYDHVCSLCDALIQYTSTRNVTEITCECGGTCTLLSVADATIQPINQQKEEPMSILNNLEASLDTAYNPNLLVTYKKIEDGETSYITDKVNDIEFALDQSRRNYKNLTEKQNAWFRKESQLRTLLEEVYADSSEQEVLAQIADIFDVPLTKEIEYTAWVRVDMTIEVDMTSDMDSIEDFISSNLTVDSYDSAIQVTNHEVERTEEGAY